MFRLGTYFGGGGGGGYFLCMLALLNITLKMKSAFFHDSFCICLTVLVQYEPEGAI